MPPFTLAKRSSFQPATRISTVFCSAGRITWFGISRPCASTSSVSQLPRVTLNSTGSDDGSVKVASQRKSSARVMGTARTSQRPSSSVLPVRNT